MQSEIIQPENIADLYSIVHGSCFLLSNASSMHFFSSIWGIKCLVLMGAANPKIWGPLGTGSHFISGLALQEQLSLKKEWHDLSAREKEIMCYKSIKIESVFDKIKGILSSSVS